MTLPSIAEAEMHVRIALLILALLAGSSISAATSTYAEAGRLLEGEWRGDEFVLRIDAARAQASIAPDRPFEWQRFLVKEAHDNEVIFSIGAELYEAKVDADTLVLTGTSFRGARVLFRNTDLRGTTAD
jgi:hypothetical protein